jgi:tryptophanyl-tRNA synthetase
MKDESVDQTSRIAHCCSEPIKLPATFFCVKCKLKTSGGIKEGAENMEREIFCPKCSSRLIRCNSCENLTSATLLSGKLFCDNCGREVLPSGSKPEESALCNRYDGATIPEAPDGHVATTRELHRKVATSIEIVLSGIRPTGRLHFGNFFGAVQHFVNFQTRGNTLGMYFIADWHALTTLEDPQLLKKNLLEMAKDYLAAGLDPNKSIIYAQSSVPEVAELSLCLSMLQPLGELEGLPTLKSLYERTPEGGWIENPKNRTLGRLTYPVLMAADILGAGATIVPVGEDQEPNVELARSLARRFNHRFGNTLTIPEMMKERFRIPGLDGEKMGKSANNAVDINLPMAEIRKRYAAGVTDKNKVRRNDPGEPKSCKSVYPIHELITKGEIETGTIATSCRNGTLGCVECKDRLVTSIAALIGPFQEKRKYWADRDREVIEILHEGGRRARKIVSETVEKVRDRMGIVLYR